MAQIFYRMGEISKSIGKKDIHVEAEVHVMNMLENGYYDKLSVLADMKRFEEYVCHAVRTLKAEIARETKSKGEKRIEVDGIQFKRAAIRKYAFEDDPRWVELKEEKDLISQALKNYEEHLKSTDTITFIDEDTGEIKGEEKLKKSTSYTLSAYFNDSPIHKK